MKLLTYRIVHDFRLKRFELGAGTVDATVAHMVKDLPRELPSGSSLELVFELWEDQTKAVPIDLTGATGLLQARPVYSPFDLVDLCSTVGATPTIVLSSSSGAGSDKNVVTCALAADLLPPTWAAYQTVRFWLKFTAVAASPVVAQCLKLWGDTRIIADDDTGEPAALSSADIPESSAIYTVDTTLPAVAGRITYVANTAANDVTFKLWNPVLTPGCEIHILKGAAAHMLYVDPNGYPINGYSDPIAYAGIGQGPLLRSIAGIWFAYNLGPAIG